MQWARAKGDFKLLTKQKFSRDDRPKSGVWIQTTQTPNLITIMSNAFTNFDRLLSVFISHDKLSNIQDMTFDGYEDLREIEIYAEKLQKLPSFGGLRNLRKLLIHAPSVKNIRQDSFEGLENLEELYVEVHHSFKFEGDDLAFIKRKGFLEGSPHLPTSKKDEIDPNKVVISNKLFETSADGERNLWISSNNQLKFKAKQFAHMGQLDEVYIIGGDEPPIFHEDTFKDSKIKSVTLAYGYYQDFDFNIIRHAGIEELTIEDEAVVQFSPNMFSELSTLESLFIRTEIGESPPVGMFNGLGNLEALDMDGAGIIEIHPALFNGLTKLVELNLGYPEIRIIRKGTFDDLHSIKHVYASLLDLEYVEEGTFDPLIKKGVEVPQEYLDKVRKIPTTDTFVKGGQVLKWEESDTLPTKWMRMCRLASKRADETGDTENPKRLLLNYLARLDIPFFNDKLRDWQNLSLRAICTNLAKLYDVYQNKQRAYNEPRRETCKNKTSNLDYSNISDKNIIYYLDEGDFTFCFTPEELRLMVNRFKTNLHTTRKLTEAELEDMKRWLDELYVSNNDGAPAWLKMLNKEEEEETYI